MPVCSVFRCVAISRNPLCPPLPSPPFHHVMCCIQTKVDWRTQKAETLLSSMDSMGASNALELLEAQGSKAAKDIRHHIQELGAKASVAISLERAIEQAKKQNGTKEGNRAWQALLTAAAFGSGEEGGSTMSTKRKAAAIGVREQSFNYAVDRAKRLKADLHPFEAIKRGIYWFWPRAKRSDVASEKNLLVMRQYWHTDEVSRAIGNSADRDMWKASKSPSAERHPRRQLIEPGGGNAVYAKFLKSADYRSFKSLQGPDFIEPGSTLFLSTRCKSLTLPVRAVSISQQEERIKIISSRVRDLHPKMTIPRKSQINLTFFQTRGCFRFIPYFCVLRNFQRDMGSTS